MNDKNGLDNTPKTIRLTNLTMKHSTEQQGQERRVLKYETCIFKRLNVLQIHPSNIDFVVGGSLLNPDASCQFTETDVPLDVDASTQFRETALSDTEPKRLAAECSSCFIKHRR